MLPHLLRENGVGPNFVASCLATPRVIVALLERDPNADSRPNMHRVVVMVVLHRNLKAPSSLPSFCQVSPHVGLARHADNQRSGSWPAWEGGGVMSVMSAFGQVPGA